jgi:hypothetical protein
MFIVTHVRKDDFGNISHVLLDSGDFINYMQAFDLARDGELDGITDASDDLGRPTIKNIFENEHDAYSLEYLPSF